VKQHEIYESLAANRVDDRLCELRLYGSRKFPKEVKRRSTPTQNSSGIHRVLVLVPIWKHIRVLSTKGRQVVEW
jgi:hypothetical protein